LFGIPKFEAKATSTEHKLCRALKENGIPFLPQQKVATNSGRIYIVDIAIPEKLIIEVGYINEIDIQELEDLQQTGYTVLHFPNKEVQDNIQNVIQTIKKARLER